MCLAKLAAGFYHEDALDAVSHGWKALDSTKHVVHESASAGSNLDELDALAGPALADPFGDEPDSKKFSKDLGDLGGGNKVSLGAELVTVLANCSGVVASQVASEAHAHVASQGDRAGSRYSFIELFGQRGGPLSFFREASAG